MHLLPGALALIFGLLAALSPARAARIWSGDRLRALPAPRQTHFLRWYRIFGIVLLLAELLLAADDLIARAYHRHQPPPARPPRFIGKYASPAV